ncbi:unnamed protein product [Adineta steineri]|uniref:EF-hand domain-containing protein n=1 Tax=Adineta steineri TaxID=433720 RepID=A0A813QNT7_9BILA|nr:unnamed protein product [Adineta steineri]CAF0769860.1 unnamed protein product [Adineta steineri]
MSSLKQGINAPRKSILPREPLTNEEEIEYKQAFFISDHDKDGLINSKELSKLIRSLERNPSDNEIQQLIENIVDAEKKLINCNQFLTMMSILKKTLYIDERKQLREIFNSFDTDGNGLIDSEDLRLAMRVLTNGNDDMKLTKEEINEMIALVDIDKDGRLSFDEFVSVFTEQV